MREKLEFEFDSKVPMNSGVFYSLSELIILKDFENEIRENFGINKYSRSYIMPGMHTTTITCREEDEYERIRTFVKRDTIIENILKLND
jgi:hypothetical protein